MITDVEKQIYNNHLVVSRRGEPFQLKKNFADLDAGKETILKKLSSFFTSYPEINQTNFFTAPYSIYEDSCYYPLEFFVTRKAVSAYTQYMKKMELENPDSDSSMERLRNSLAFVYHFCKEKNISFKEYQTYTEDSLPFFLDHLKKHKINFYTLHALTFANPVVESSLLEFVIPNFFLTFQKTKTKFYTSSKMRLFSQIAKEKLETKLNISV